MTCFYSWVQELLSFSGYSHEEVTELIQWLLEEMAVIAKRNNWTFELRKEISRFEKRLPTTLQFLNRLFEGFRLAASNMGLPEEAFRLLYRRSVVPKASDAYMELTRQALSIIGPERFGAAQKVHDRIVSNIKRASILVENVNSRLCTFMDIKKHVSSYFYSLVQLYLNTKKYRRSRVEYRKGLSPVEILTGEQWPEFIDLLEERGFWEKALPRKLHENYIQ